MADKPKEDWVKGHASSTADFFKALIDGGVPEQTAENMAQEFNHQSLRAHFRQ